MKNLFCIGLVSLAFTICLRATAQEAPVIVNPETGAVVNFSRAYWDANVDIANKRMQCDYFSFDAETGVFVKGEDRPAWPIFDESNLHLFNTQYTHLPLANETTQINFALVELPTQTIDRSLRLPFWTVNNGSYGGPAVLSRSDFVEIVALNSSTDNAVRVWFEVDNVPAYSVCYDAGGTALLPTGTIGSDNTQLVDLPNLTFDFPDVYENIPEIINRETGQAVQFERGRWNYNKDVAGRSITCETTVWNPDFQSYTRVPDSGDAFAYSTYDGGENVFRAFRALIDDTFFSISEVTASTFSLIDRFSFIGTGTYMELSETGYRMWQSATQYDDCVVRAITPEGLFELPPFGVPEQLEIPAFQPTELLPLVAVDSIPVEPEDTGPFVVTDNCDYTDADDFDGYGFDPVTMMSCPPLTNDTSVDEVSDVVDNTDGTGATQDSNVVSNPGTTDDSSGSLEEINTTSADTADSLPDDSTGNSDDAATTAEDEDNAVENEVVASDTQAESDSTGQVATAESTSQSGGGSFWLPVLIFVLAIRHPMLAIKINSI